MDWDICVFDSLDSTQNLCMERAANGAVEGLVIQALQQSAGRGRHGRTWKSGQGSLTCSLLLKPDCNIRDVGQISILIGVALAQALIHLDVNDVRVKWPNDVLIAGQKCAGILIDSDLTGDQIYWLTIGIGANTGHAPKMGSLIPATRDVFLAILLERIATLYEQWCTKGFTDIRDMWLNLTYPKGTALNVGMFETLDEYGNLVVRDGAGALQTHCAGDVFLKDVNYAAGD